MQIKLRPGWWKMRNNSEIQIFKRDGHDPFNWFGTLENGDVIVWTDEGRAVYDNKNTTHEDDIIEHIRESDSAQIQHLKQLVQQLAAQAFQPDPAQIDKLRYEVAHVKELLGNLNQHVNELGKLPALFSSQTTAAGHDSHPRGVAFYNGNGLWYRPQD